MSSRIVVLMQGLAGPGGIQRHSRSFCRAVGEYAAAHAMQLEVLSFTDYDGWFDPHYLERPLRGSHGRRAHFVAQALAALARPYDLLVVGQVDFGPIALLPHLLRPRTPVLAITHGIEVWSRLPAHKLAGLQIADMVMSVSDFTAKQLIALQEIEPRRTMVVPCILDPEIAALAERRVAAQAARRPGKLLSISRMAAHDRDKGIDMVIEALPGLRKQAPGVSYTIVGDGADRPRLEQLAHSLGVADIIDFAGRVPDEQLHQHLSTAEVFVLPSRKEGFGIVFLEAMAYGLPVVAGAHGGSPEVVIGGETGLLVEHGNVEALTSALLALLRNPALRQAMGQAGRQRVGRVYSYERSRALIHATLNGLLRQPADQQAIVRSRSRRQPGARQAELRSHAAGRTLEQKERARP